MSARGTTSARGEWRTCRYFGCYYSSDWPSGMATHEEHHAKAGDLTDAEYAQRFADAGADR